MSEMNLVVLKNQDVDVWKKGTQHFDEIFVLEGTTYRTKDVPKAASFNWDGINKRWWSNDAKNAARLIQFAGDEVKQRLAAISEDIERNVKESRATDADIEIPVPEGLEYLPFQRAGIAYASQRQSTLIGDDMGLGKTIQAIGAINMDSSIQSVLVVSPATLKLNWKREMEKWLVDKELANSIGIASGTDIPDTKIVIINYDILKKNIDALKKMTFDFMTVDECHYLKNCKAQRTKAAFSLKAKRRVFLTGTPIVNRPVELFGIINALDKDNWPNFFSYAKTFCNAQNNGYGWDFSGAKNLDLLQEKLRSTIMIRRLKAEVLKELPAKRRQVIEIAPNGASAFIKKEQKAAEAQKEQMAKLRAAVELAKASDDEEVYNAAVANLKEAATSAFTEMSRLRHETALAKVPYVIEHVKDAIGDNDSKVIVFAHHIDVVKQLAGAFGDSCVTLTGSTDMQARQDAVDRFQNDPSCTVFIGNIKAAGVGITLTASSHVVFAELSWVPGDITQCEDRANRIGQVNSVLVQHLVLEGSIDAQMAKTLVSKQNVIDSALDKEHDTVVLPEVGLPEELPEAPEEEAATKSTSRSKIEELAKSITPERTVAIQECLAILASMDTDNASVVNGAGFNKVDTVIGKDLAARQSLSPKQAALAYTIVKKYHRQLPAELLEVATG